MALRLCKHTAKQLQWCSIENQQSPIFVVNWHISRILIDDESAATTLPSWLIFTITKGFSVRYSMSLYLETEMSTFT